MPLNPEQTFESELKKLKEDEAAKIRAMTVASDGQKSLDRLFDYTKFHIGLYLTLTASYVAVASVKGQDSKLLLELAQTWFWAAILCFMFAGLAGGIIASSLTQTAARSTASFLAEEIGPWSLKLLQARTWTWIEHTSFWAGLIFALLSIRLR